MRVRRVLVQPALVRPVRVRPVRVRPVQVRPAQAQAEAQSEPQPAQAQQAPRALGSVLPREQVPVSVLVPVQGFEQQGPVEVREVVGCQTQGSAASRSETRQAPQWRCRSGCLWAQGSADHRWHFEPALKPSADRWGLPWSMHLLRHHSLHHRRQKARRCMQQPKQSGARRDGWSEHVESWKTC